MDTTGRKPPTLPRTLAILALALTACSLWSALALSPPETAAPAAASPTSSPVPLATAAVETGQPEAGHNPGEAETASPPTPTLAPSPTAAPILRQLTTGGCCANPFWSPDGQQVLFIDRPASDATLGLWGVDLEGGNPELYADRLGLYSSDMQLLAYLEGGETVVERLVGGGRWIVPNGGRAVSFSPDGSLLAWTVGSGRAPFDTSQNEVWTSQVDGSRPGLVARLYGGGLAGWFPDGRLLLLGRTGPGEQTAVYMSVAPDGSDLREIARGHRLRSGLLSPGGSWLAYQAVFGDDPHENGLWIANTLTAERRRLDYFGAYRWRDDGRLLLVPQDLASERHRLLQVDAASGEALALTDPTTTPFKVANGDWSVSPDGKYIVFLSADDGNIWSLTLP